MAAATQPTRRGRKAIHKKELRPDGLTDEQYRLLTVLAQDADVSIAQLKRRILVDYFTQFGYTLEDQGLEHDEYETR